MLHFNNLIKFNSFPTLRIKNFDFLNNALLLILFIKFNNFLIKLVLIFYRLEICLDRLDHQNFLKRDIRKSVY